MEIRIHQTNHSIADFEGVFSYLKNIDLNDNNDLHLFPELFLTGYPLQDLCFDKSFIESYQTLLKRIKIFSSSIPKDKFLFLGGLDYELEQSGIPKKIKNVIYQLSKDKLQVVYTKQLLPNYDIFEEKKYFEAGDEKTVLNILDKNIGFLICEDMWSSSIHKHDPVCQLKEDELDLVINLSASPFNVGKGHKRVERAKDISNFLKCPYIYVNRVAGEDEILFDGQSFVQDGDVTVLKAKLFKEESLDYQLKSLNKYTECYLDPNANTWETLFNPRLNDDLEIMPLSDESCCEILEALKFGFSEYAKKSHFNNFTVALSGGMDSALVLTILRLALTEGQYLEAVYMPSIHSSSLSYDLSHKLCQGLGIPLFSLPIKFLHSATKNLFSQTFTQKFEGITDENIQSRLRGTLLYTRSNQINSMIVNTSNKSELAVGYSTQYGDSVGAISLLGDLYKSEVFALAKYINKINNNIIPDKIITRPPTAELKEGQEDSQSLPTYDILDSILEAILSNRYSKSDLIVKKFKQNDVEKVLNLYRKTEYKRYQFCPIIKLSPRSFGFGHRMPISKNSGFYLNKGEINE